MILSILLLVLSLFTVTYFFLCSFDSQGHDLSADCWSLGILIFELLTGRWFLWSTSCKRQLQSRGEGGGTLLYKTYRYVPPLKGTVFAPFRSENGYRLCPFWSGIGYCFRRNYGSVWMCMQFQFQMTKKERIIREFGWIWRNLFVGVLIYYVMTWFRRGQTWKGIWILEASSRLKTGVKNDMFWP